MKTELVTTLKRQATKILSDLHSSGEPVLITEHGKPSAYLIDVDSISFPGKFGNTRIPGREVWGQVRTGLKPNDEIWTFGVLDCGSVIIREGKVFCMIVVTHNM